MQVFSDLLPLSQTPRSSLSRESLLLDFDGLLDGVLGCPASNLRVNRLRRLCGLFVCGLVDCGLVVWGLVVCGL